MANVSAVLQAVTPFKTLLKRTHLEKKGTEPAVSKPRGLFADLETELNKNNGIDKR